MYVGSGVVNVDEAKVPATTEVFNISRKLFPSRENDTNEFAIRPHPLLFVEADKTWGGGINGVIPAHLYLCKREEGYRHRDK